MPDSEPTFYSSPLPPHGTAIGGPGISNAELAAASRQESQRQMALTRAVGRVRPQLPPKEPPLKAPALPANFGQRIGKLDAEIFSRGIAIERDKLLALGRERFAQLLDADRQARSRQRIIGTRIDLSQWISVECAFVLAGALEARSVPTRKTSEVFAGRGKERDDVRQFNGFVDLWKSTQDPQTVQNVYAFRDVFESLLFGQSLLERTESDRVRSVFFVRSATGRKVELFGKWVSVLQRPIASVTIRDPLTTVFSWLLEEKLSAPSTHDYFSDRLPSQHQTRFTEALWHGFLLGHSDWQLWNYVGQRTRTVPDMAALSRWRTDLAKRFPTVEQFHRDVASFFYRDVGNSHMELDRGRYRQFIHRGVREMLDTVSSVTALAIEEKLVARFQDWILLEGKPAKDLHEKITKALATAFAGSKFQVEINP